MDILIHHSVSEYPLSLKVSVMSFCPGCSSIWMGHHKKRRLNSWNTTNGFRTWIRTSSIGNNKLDMSDTGFFSKMTWDGPNLDLLWGCLISDHDDHVYSFCFQTLGIAWYSYTMLYPQNVQTLCEHGWGVTNHDFYCGTWEVAQLTHFWVLLIFLSEYSSPRELYWGKTFRYL